MARKVAAVRRTVPCPNDAGDQPLANEHLARTGEVRDGGRHRKGSSAQEVEVVVAVLEHDRNEEAEDVDATHPRRALGQRRGRPCVHDRGEIDGAAVESCQLAAADGRRPRWGRHHRARPCCATAAPSPAGRRRRATRRAGERSGGGREQHDGRDGDRETAAHGEAHHVDGRCGDVVDVRRVRVKDRKSPLKFLGLLDFPASFSPASPPRRSPCRPSRER